MDYARLIRIQAEENGFLPRLSTRAQPPRQDLSSSSGIPGSRGPLAACTSRRDTARECRRRTWRSFDGNTPRSRRGTGRHSPTSVIPEIEYETLKSAPGVHGCYRGLHEITEFFDSWSDLYAEFRVEAAEIVDAGDQVVTVERHAARGLKGSDAESWVQDSFACLISFKDGKIWRIEEFPTLEAGARSSGSAGIGPTS